MAETVATGAGAGRRPILPPYSLRRDFLPAAMVSDLLDLVQSRHSAFKPTKVGAGARRRINPDRRLSHKLRDFEPLQSALDALLRPLGPALAAQLQVQAFETAQLELELVAHGDGAFFKRHIDLQRPAPDVERKTMRVLSGVYYFHVLPKAFAGGALRLFAIGAGEEDGHFVDVEPTGNTLVFFPSWMPHEVRPVQCPSGRFMDSRFAINCWFHRAV